MKLTLSLIKQFVDIKDSPQRLAERLTQAGVKVEEVEKVGGDYVFSFEITTNRGDLLGALGIAREISAITGTPLKSFNRPLSPFIPSEIKRSSEPKDLTIEVQNPRDCPRYLGALLAVKMGPSPDWLKHTLTLCGLRPANNVVDITNYLMLKYGQPTHAFDDQKVRGGKITVRKAKRGESLITLDHKMRKLDPHHLVIADQGGPIALAGVLGGLETEISARTKSIILEIATFAPADVRRAEVDFNLRTEASLRFERGLDPYLPAVVFSEAQKLLGEHAQAKLLTKPVDIKKLPGPKTLILDRAFVGRILGIRIPLQEIAGILKRLGIGVKISSMGISCKIPAFRKDLGEEIDLVEEIARIYGYEKIPPVLPSGEYPNPTPLLPQKRYEVLKQVKQTLSRLGLSEAYTFSLTSKQEKAVKVANPLSEENAYLRVSLLPGLFKAARANPPNFERVGLFEVGKIFPSEAINIAAILRAKNPYLELKGILEAFLEELGIEEFLFKPSDERIADILVKGKKIGKIEAFREEEEISRFELDFEKLYSFAAKARIVKPIPSFPSLLEDVSFIVTKKTHMGPILSKIKEVSPLISGIKIADVFPQGGEEKSITLRISYQDLQKNLSNEDILPTRERISLLLKELFGAKLR